MDRKEFLSQFWKRFLIPLLLIGVGATATYILSIIISDFVFIDFLTDFALKGLVVLFVLHLFIWGLDKIKKKTISKLPENILHKTHVITRTVDCIISWMAPIALGAILYDAWVNGNRWFAIGYTAAIIILKIRESISKEKATNNVQPHTPT